MCAHMLNWCVTLLLLGVLLCPMLSTEALKMNGKHKRCLRAIAGRMKIDKTLNIIPFNSLTEGSIRNIKESLATHELLQLRLNNLDKAQDVKIISASLAEETGSEVVQTVGHTLLLFKPLKPTSAMSVLLKQELEKGTVGKS